MTVGRDGAESFDEWAPTYDEHVTAGKGFPFTGYEDVLAAVVDVVVGARPARVLELGIGTGNVGRAIADRNPSIELWGLDFSPVMLARAAEKLPGAQLVQADLGDLSSLDLPRFDAVLAAYVLHEFTEDRKLELLEHLFDQRVEPTGIVVVGDVAFRTANDRVEARRAEAARWDPDEHYFAADELLGLLRERQISGTYRQISSHAGVFVFVRAPFSAA